MAQYEKYNANEIRSELVGFEDRLAYDRCESRTRHRSELLGLEVREKDFAFMG